MRRTYFVADRPHFLERAVVKVNLLAVVRPYRVDDKVIVYPLLAVRYRIKVCGDKHLAIGEKLFGKLHSDAVRLVIRLDLARRKRLRVLIEIHTAGLAP